VPAWVIVVIGAGLIVAIVVGAGLRYWAPHASRPDAQMNLGVGLLTGAIVALAVLTLQVAFDLRVASIEDRRREEQAARDATLRAQSARENLQLTVGLRQILDDIDLRSRNLVEFYFGGRSMRRAQLGGANLNRAVLAGADLREADLFETTAREVTFARADLRGASFILADLRGATLEGALLHEAEFAQADLRGADLSSTLGAGTADFSDAMYDRDTGWPDGVTVPACEQPPCRMP
jgi:uncharacterized protein YjbI with pentapeptide repeats